MYESSRAVLAVQPIMADLSIIVLPEFPIATTLIIIGVVGIDAVVFPITVPIAITSFSPILIFIGRSGGIQICLSATLCTGAGRAANNLLSFFQGIGEVVTLDVIIVKINHPCLTFVDDLINMC